MSAICFNIIQLCPNAIHTMHSVFIIWQLNNNILHLTADSDVCSLYTDQSETNDIYQTAV